MANSICIEEGCSEPRWGQYVRCQSHQRERWRAKSEQNRRKQGLPENKRRGARGSLAKCSLCHRTPRQAAVMASQGITCTGCNPATITRQMDYLQAQLRRCEQAEPVVVIEDKAAAIPPVESGEQRPVTAKIIASCYGSEEGLLVLEARAVQRLPMPETEAERRQIVADYVRQGYLVAE